MPGTNWDQSDDTFPDNKVHGANMEPTWVLSAPSGPHVGPMNLAIGVVYSVFEITPRLIGSSKTEKLRSLACDILNKFICFVMSEDSTP